HRLFRTKVPRRQVDLCLRGDACARRDLFSLFGEAFLAVKTEIYIRAVGSGDLGLEISRNTSLTTGKVIHGLGAMARIAAMGKKSITLPSEKIEGLPETFPGRRAAASFRPRTVRAHCRCVL